MISTQHQCNAAHNVGDKSRGWWWWWWWVGREGEGWQTCFQCVTPPCCWRGFSQTVYTWTPLPGDSAHPCTKHINRKKHQYKILRTTLENKQQQIKWPLNQKYISQYLCKIQKQNHFCTKHTETEVSKLNMQNKATTSEEEENAQDNICAKYKDKTTSVQNIRNKNLFFFSLFPTVC